MRRTIGNRFLSLIIIISLGFIYGCGSSSSSKSTSQEVIFSDYSMMINKDFISVDPSTLVDRRFRGSIIAAYSMPTSLENTFEKNIIIIKDNLGSFTLENYVNQAVGGIVKTRGGYTQSSLNADKVTCNDKKIPSFQHNFSIVRGGITGTGQTIYFMQYFFAKDKEIFILSSSTDNKNDLDALDIYKTSIHCTTGTLVP